MESSPEQLPYAYPRGLLEEAASESPEERGPGISSIADILCNAWQVYSSLVQNERLWEILNVPQDKDSAVQMDHLDVFYLQKTIVRAADALGRTLAGPPNVVDELQWLMGQYPNEFVSDIRENFHGTETKEHKDARQDGQDEQEQEELQ
jgi:hypothetical protein